MTKKLLTLSIAVAAVAVASQPALANCGGPLQPACDSVPEIDAGAGVAALAALGASVALLRERFKR